ncbi:uncharacterized protein ACRADG_008349 [Cochliomyia hominivorax]
MFKHILTCLTITCLFISLQRVQCIGKNVKTSNCYHLDEKGSCINVVKHGSIFVAPKHIKMSSTVPINCEHVDHTGKCFNKSRLFSDAVDIKNLKPFPKHVKNMTKSWLDWFKW